MDQNSGDVEPSEVIATVDDKEVIDGGHGRKSGKGQEHIDQSVADMPHSHMMIDIREGKENQGGLADQVARSMQSGPRKMIRPARSARKASSCRRSSGVSAKTVLVDATVSSKYFHGTLADRQSEERMSHSGRRLIHEAGFNFPPPVRERR
jgi:hypothetical protein